MDTENNKKLSEGLEEFVKEIAYNNLVPTGWEVIKGEHLLKMEISKREFLIDGLLPSQGIIILSGNPGCGKSWLAIEIARVISSASSSLFNKFEAKDGSVLYIDEESNIQEMQRRWKALGADILSFTDFTFLRGFKIDNREEREKLLDFVSHKKYCLVIFDSLRDIHSKNENDSQQAQELIDYFRELIKMGSTVLILHHNRKESFLNSKDPSQLLRGSTAILAGLDCLISVESKKINDRVIEFTISQPKLRQGKPVSPFKLNLVEEEGKIKFEYVGEIEEEATKLQKAKEAILELLKDGEKYHGEIVQTLISLYFAERTTNRAIKELKEGKNIQPRKDGKKIYYTIGAMVPSD